jgi:hypothetical protein
VKLGRKKMALANVYSLSLKLSSEKPFHFSSLTSGTIIGHSLKTPLSLRKPLVSPDQTLFGNMVYHVAISYGQYVALE